MLRSRAIVAAAALGLLAPSAGCGGSQRSLASLDGLAAGTTTLRVANHVSAPEELDQLTIAVDGHTLPLSALPPSGGDPSTVGLLRLPPGAHSIAVRAVLRRARDAGGVSVAFAQHPFLVERGPALIGVDVRSAMSEDAAAQGVSPALRLTMMGGLMAPGSVDAEIPRKDAEDQRCGALLPIPRALCRAAIDLDEAGRKNDIVAALCLRDKLAELRKLAVIGESGGAESVSLAEAQAILFARQADRCIGDVVASPAPDGLTVTRVGVR